MEVQAHYVDTMSRVYYALFRSYFASLLRLEDEIAGKDDLVGASEDSSKSLFTSKHVTRGRVQSVFLLGDRANILKEIASPFIVPHAATQVRYHTCTLSH